MRSGQVILAKQVLLLLLRRLHSGHNRNLKIEFWMRAAALALQPCTTPCTSDAAALSFLGIFAVISQIGESAFNDIPAMQQRNFTKKKHPISQGATTIAVKWVRGRKGSPLYCIEEEAQRIWGKRKRTLVLYTKELEFEK